MIGSITILARLVGFGRQVVFAHSVGATCLGTAYTTANMVPNLIYDIVLGGALTAVVVPVLAGPASASGSTVSGSDQRARQIASALLTWTILLLMPVSACVAVFAHPLVGALLGHAGGCSRGAMTGVGGRMLIVFAPQVLLYGIAVVLYGILQAHRKFGGPAVAPLLSSLVVVGTYAAFGVADGAFVNRLGDLPASAEYLLSGGTTLGVLAMVAAAAVPAWKLRLAVRPTLRFPPGVAMRVRRLAVAGLFTLLAQDASTAVVIVLANRYGPAGTLVIYGFAWAVFVVPYAVLAVPIATSAFPELSARSTPTDSLAKDARPLTPAPPHLQPDPPALAPDLHHFAPEPRPLPSAMHPFGPDPRPPAPDPRALASAAGRVTSDRPVTSDPRPLAPDARPLTSAPRPVAPDAHPLMPDARHPRPDSDTLAPEPRPLPPAAHPLAPDPRALAPDACPATPDRAVTPEPRHLTPDRQALTSAPRPATPDAHPLVPDVRHLESDPDTLASDARPLASAPNALTPDPHPPTSDPHPRAQAPRPVAPEHPPFNSSPPPPNPGQALPNASSPPPSPFQADISEISPDRGFAATSAASTRAVLLASCLGVAALIGARVPLARVFESDSASATRVLAASLAAFAPGLIGYGLSANLSRVLYAHGRNRAPALAISLGWALVIVADVLVVPFVPRAWVVPALGACTSLGLTVAGAVLLILVLRARGRVALAGVARACGAGLAGCVIGAAVGGGVSSLVQGEGLVINAGLSAGVCAVIAAAFCAVVWNVDGGDLRAAFTRLRMKYHGADTPALHRWWVLYSPIAARWPAFSKGDTRVDTGIERARNSGRPVPGSDHTVRPAARGPEPGGPGPGAAWRSPVAWLVAVVPGVLGLITGWYHVSVPPLWRDEGVTKTMATRSVSQILATMPHDDVVHGAYYLVIHAVVTIAGSGSAELRFPSVVAMAVAAAVTALIARRLAMLAKAPVPAVTGLVAGMLFALLPGVIRYAQEARSYAIVTMLAAIATYLLIEAVSGGGGARRWTAYGVAVGLTGLFNIFGLFLLAAHVLTLLAVALCRGTGDPAPTRTPGRRRHGRGHREKVAGIPVGWFVAVVVAVVVLIPVVALAYTERGALAWMASAPSIPETSWFLVLFWAGSRHLVWLLFGLAALGVVAEVAVSIARRVGTAGNTRVAANPRVAENARVAGDAGGGGFPGLTPVTVALPWLVVPSAVLLVASQVHPMWSDRYMEYCTPGLAILAAWGLAWLVRALRAPLRGAWQARVGWLAVLPAAAILALIVDLLLSAGALMRQPSSRADDLQRDSQIVAANARPGDIVFFIPITFRSNAQAFPAGWRGVRDIALGQTPVASDTLDGYDVSPAELLKRFTDVSRVWVFSTVGTNAYLASPRATPIDHLEAQLLSRMKFVRRWHDGDQLLSLYETRPPAKAHAGSR